MNILECEIEDMVFNGLINDMDLLKSKGFPCSSDFTYVRQFCIGNYGRADIVGFKVYPKRFGCRTIEVDVFELKKDKISAATFFQGARYMKGLQRMIREENITNCHIETNLYLIGKSIDLETDFVYAMDVVINVSLFTYSIDLKLGVKFEQHSGYYLSGEGFSCRDTSLMDVLKANVAGNIKSADLVNNDFEF